MAALEPASAYVSSDEKNVARDNSIHDGSNTTDTTGEPVVDPALTTKVTRKLDIALLPLLGMSKQFPTFYPSPFSVSFGQTGYDRDS
jgi:hypothetical protein